MPATPLEVLWPQIQCTKLFQALRPRTPKFVQQLRQRLSFAQLYVPSAIKRLKRPTFSGFQYDSRPRNPVRLFAINQVSDDVEHVPCVATLISVSPLFGQFAQQRIQSGRRAGKKRYSLL